MKRFKKGSSLVLVLIVLCILSILGTSITTLAVSNYKMKVMSSNKKISQYSAESGIDEAYGMIGEIVDEAIADATNEAEKYSDALNLDTEIANKENGLGSEYINDDLTIKENFLEILSEKQNEKFQEVYKKYIEDELTNNLIAKLENPAEYKYSTDFTKNPKVLVIRSLGDDIKFSDVNILTIKLRSSFTHKDIPKVLYAEYEITVPEYKQAYYYESNHVKIEENIAWTKAIAADGDMIINSNNVKVVGDIFAKGKDKNKDEGKDKDEDKYVAKNGISVEVDNASKDTSIGFFVDGNIITQNDFKISSKNSVVKISKDIYARNVSIESDAEGVDLNIDESVYTNDDLELDGLKSNITIKKYFYGIDDGGDGGADTSSSIIINSDDIGKEDESGKIVGSSLNIESGAIIRGTSYINVNSTNPYQTGESVSVKGNYKAYAHSFADGTEVEKKDKTKINIGENNIYFDYYDPLTLVKGFKDGSDLNAIERGYYLKEYHNSVSGLYFKGINIKNVKFATGAIVNIDGEIEVGRNILDSEDEIEKKLKEISKAMNNMGKNLKDDTKSPNGKVLTVNNQVEFSKIPIDNTLSTAEDLIILKRPAIPIDDESDKKNYILSFPDAEVPDDIENSEKITIYSDNNKGIIIVDGNLHIYGKMNFKGTIIASGDIYIKDINEKNIIYDKTYIKQLIAKNHETFKDIFKKDESNPYIDVQVDPKSDKDSSIGYYIKKDKVIKLKNWKIEK